MLNYVVSLYFDETQTQSVKGLISGKTEKAVDKFYDWSLETVIPESLMDSVESIHLVKVNPKEAIRLRKEDVLFDVVAEKF